MPRGEQLILTLPLPEVREMIAAAIRYVVGEAHYSSLAGPTERCVWWARVYGAHPEIRRLAADWQAWVDQTWNEWGQHAHALPEAELRRRIAADLGLGTSRGSRHNQPLQRTGG